MSIMKVKFSRKLLGKKIRTQMLMHRIVLKFYENGITIKAWKNQGVHNCPLQEEIFLTNENADYLLEALGIVKSVKKMAENLEEKEEEKTLHLYPPHITLKPIKTYIKMKK